MSKLSDRIASFPISKLPETDEQWALREQLINQALALESELAQAQARIAELEKDVQVQRDAANEAILTRFTAEEVQKAAKDSVCGESCAACRHGLRNPCPIIRALEEGRK